MQHIPKQTQYVRCPALELMCNSLCGPMTKMFRKIVELFVNSS